MTAADPRALNSLIEWWAEFGIEPLEAPAPPRRAPALGARETKPAPATAPSLPASPSPLVPEAAPENPNADGRALARSAETVDALEAALGRFEGCALKHTARNLVFARGDPASPVMVIGEGPGAEEDRQGAPFVGRSGQLLDKMLAAIGIAPEAAYITNVVYWRPPGNRKPSDGEIEACRPFFERHIALARPKVLLLAGGISAGALLRATSGIMALRGQWREIALDPELGEGLAPIPALPTFHPAYLLRRPQEKAKAWRDMLSLQARLETS